ncbi:L,D-transpeptidase family protein [Leptospira harrisiae]|uniref:L,D-transpeptidase family protein n=1 Tax=Leptospira harrisiae TaxID=2023189 RepID=UPI0013FD4B5F|nr:L,D-transpeptidase family protein [Leptospira harrisiae]
MISFNPQNLLPKITNLLDISLKISRIFSLAICFFLLSSGFPLSLFGSQTIEGDKSDTKEAFHESEQIIFITAYAKETKGNLYFYSLEDGEWKPVLENIPVRLGKNGIIQGEVKREGDGHTPSGIFPVQRILGKEKRKIQSLEYIEISKNSHWTDVSTSKHYNQLIKHKEKGAVSLWDSGIYELFIVIEHNTSPPIPGYGSMIFLHPWNEDKPTSGCVGVPKDILDVLVSTLDGRKNPYIILRLLD